MRKIDSLRAALEVAIPSLAKGPERLLIFIDKGKVVFTAAKTPSFEYRYRATIILQDFTADEDLVFLALMLWLRENNEWELLQGYVAGDRDGISFEADVLDSDKVDLQIGIDLVERVVVTATEGGGWTITHPPEPVLADDLGGAWPGFPLNQVTANGALIVPAE